MGFWETLGLMVGSGGLGAGLQFVLTWLLKKDDQRVAHKRQSRDDFRAEYKEIFDRLKDDIMELKAEVADLKSDYADARTREDECQRRLSFLDRELAMQVTRNEYIENELTKAGINFTPWTKPHTDEHTPLKDD